jgi:hypothetical protein
MRARLATETPLYVAASGSAGAITAQLKTVTGWNDGLVDLKLDGGELVARAAQSGTITLHRLELGLETITIPATVIGHQAALTRPHLRLAAPAELTTMWNDDDNAEATATATLDLELSWVLTVDGVGLPLGAPDLPPLSVKLELSGNGEQVTAELRLHAAGELWSWADLVKLSDLALVLGADTP